MSSKVSLVRKEVDSGRRDRTRQRLLIAAARIIGEQGETKATIEDFIRAAEVSRGTFYNYYSTKSELLDDLWQTVGRDPFKAIQIACAGTADPAERVGIQIRLVLAYAQVNRVWGWLIYALSRDAETVNSDLISFPRPDLLAGQAAERFRFSNLNSAGDLVVGTVRRGLNALLRERPGSRYAEELCLMILCGLGVSYAEASEIANKTLLEMPG